MSGIDAFRLPDVGEGIAEAEIIEWLVETGDEIGEDQVAVVIETDKSQVELPSPLAGRVVARHGHVGDIVRVGDVLIEVERTGADQPIDTAASPASPAAGDASADAVSSRDPVDLAASAGAVLASPYVRRLAHQRGIRLDEVTASGPHGRVLLADLDAFDRAPLSEPSPQRALPAAAAVGATEEIPLRGLRRRIAQSMTEAMSAPHIWEFKQIDATALLDVHRRLRVEFEKDGLRLSVLPLLMLATIRALRRNRTLNATFDPAAETVTRHGSVNLGMATAADDGLIVPVLHHADAMTLRELATAVDLAAERARARESTPQELTGGTFTVTNFGSFGAWLGTPIIRPPEVGIAGFGKISDQVVAVDGRPEVRPVLPIVVAADHRINDGADLGAFAGDLAAALVAPALLLD